MLVAGSFLRDQAFDELGRLQLQIELFQKEEDEKVKIVLIDRISSASKLLSANGLSDLQSTLGKSLEGACGVLTSSGETLTAPQRKRQTNDILSRLSEAIKTVLPQKNSSPKSLIDKSVPIHQAAFLYEIVIDRLNELKNMITALLQSSPNERQIKVLKDSLNEMASAIKSIGENTTLSEEIRGIFKKFDGQIMRVNLFTDGMNFPREEIERLLIIVDSAIKTVKTIGEIIEFATISEEIIVSEEATPALLEQLLNKDALDDNDAKKIDKYAKQIKTRLTYSSYSRHDEMDYLLLGQIAQLYLRLQPQEERRTKAIEILAFVPLDYQDMLSPDLKELLSKAPALTEKDRLSAALDKWEKAISSWLKSFDRKDDLRFYAYGIIDMTLEQAIEDIQNGGQEKEEKAPTLDVDAIQSLIDGKQYVKALKQAKIIMLKDEEMGLALLSSISKGYWNSTPAQRINAVNAALLMPEVWQNALFEDEPVLLIVVRQIVEGCDIIQRVDAFKATFAATAVLLSSLDFESSQAARKSLAERLDKIKQNLKIESSSPVDSHPISHMGMQIMQSAQRDSDEPISIKVLEDNVLAYLNLYKEKELRKKICDKFLLVIDGIKADCNEIFSENLERMKREAKNDSHNRRLESDRKERRAKKNIAGEIMALNNASGNEHYNLKLMELNDLLYRWKKSVTSVSRRIPIEEALQIIHETLIDNLQKVSEKLKTLGM